MNIKESNKCKECNRKLKLSDIKCKCNNRYCIEHIFSKDHGCEYDFKGDFKKILFTQNKKLKSNNKLEKL